MKLQNRDMQTARKSLERLKAAHAKAEKVRIDKIAEEWCENEDRIETFNTQRAQMRDTLIALVGELGGGEDVVSTARFEIRATRIKPSTKLDGEKFHKLLGATPHLAKYAKNPDVVTVRTVYEVNESKVIQLVERGIIPATILRKCVVKGESRGSVRLTVKRKM